MLVVRVQDCNANAVVLASGILPYFIEQRLIFGGELVLPYLEPVEEIFFIQLSELLQDPGGSLPGLFDLDELGLI